MASPKQLLERIKRLEEQRQPVLLEPPLSRFRVMVEGEQPNENERVTAVLSAGFRVVEIIGSENRRNNYGN